MPNRHPLDGAFSRRRLLAGSGGMAAVATLGLLPLGRDTRWALFPGPDAAEQSPRFDLGGKVTTVVRNQALHDGSVMQSCAFDPVHNHVYTLQVAHTDGHDEADGNLTVTRLDLSAAARGSSADRQWMRLLGFGHGCSMAVEVDGDDVYLWTEVDSKPRHDPGGPTGRGTKIARFAFDNGATLHTDSSKLKKHQPVSGATQFTPGIDPVNNRIYLRYYKDDAFRVAVFDLDDVKNGDYGAPVYHDVPIPSLKIPGGDGTRLPQGWAVLGRYGYFLTGAGEKKGGTTPDPPRIICFDLADKAKVRQDVKVTAGSDLDYREPEGLAIWLPHGADADHARLTLGFASSFTSGHRKANIYYIEAKA